MTITVVKGLLGKPVEQVPDKAAQNLANTQNVVKAAQQAVTTQPLSSEAVVTTIRASRPVERGERIETFKKAKEVTEEVREEIRSNRGEAMDAHRGLNATGSREAFV